MSVAASIESIGGNLDRSTSASGGFSAAAGDAGFGITAGSVGGGTFTTAFASRLRARPARKELLVAHSCSPS